MFTGFSSVQQFKILASTVVAASLQAFLILSSRHFFSTLFRSLFLRKMATSKIESLFNVQRNRAMAWKDGGRKKWKENGGHVQCVRDQ